MLEEVKAIGELVVLFIAAFLVILLITKAKEKMSELILMTWKKIRRKS